jgi:cytoskeletal protein CcmA (bactofilin family)
MLPSRESAPPTAYLGPSIHITGEVSAAEPLIIAGSVDGTITLSDYALTIVAGSRIHADVVAGSILISGNVIGCLKATGRIVAEQSAAIEGSLSAPAIMVVDGAHVQGKVEVGSPRRAVLPAAS